MNGRFMEFLYLIASLLFIVGLKDLNRPETARRGVGWSALGMLLAVVGTLLHHEIIRFEWILLGLLLGAAIGTAMAIFIPMAKMPERIALSHAFGGLAAALVGVSEYTRHASSIEAVKITAIGLEVLLGALTFTGSLAAFGKLQGLLPERPVTYPLQNMTNLGLFGATLMCLGLLILSPTAAMAFFAVIFLSLALGPLMVLPIGGADMPVVIALLNSYAGLAAAATGFAISNNVLIICGALDGSSGFILSILMSRAMHRSFTNVLFGAFGKQQETAPQTAHGRRWVREGSPEDAATILENAESLIVVPGYGMAAAQAQKMVQELAQFLEHGGMEVKYAVHPVAGRMPGHMSVLLAEANVPYEKIFDLEAINDEFQNTDVVLVVGANDVVNPAARSNPQSPIYGMPILNADHSRNVVVLKRSMNPGFAGIDNDLFYRPNAMMVFGDAKHTLTDILTILRERRNLTMPLQ
jgi:NAD(P) transhydrogenase subunit beta